MFLNTFENILLVQSKICFTSSVLDVVKDFVEQAHSICWISNTVPKALAKRSNIVGSTFEICLSSKMSDRLDTSKNSPLPIFQYFLFASSKKCF